MSYLVTLEPGRAEVGIRNNCDEITPDNYNNIYQTKLDLSIRNSKNVASFPLVCTSMNQLSRHDKVQFMELVNAEATSMDVDSANTATTAVENREGDPSVETKSCGNISALINHFKNVEATTHSDKISVSKVPVKKLRLDLQNVAVDQISSTTKTMNTNRDIQTPGRVTHGNMSLPVVKLNFKMHAEETTQKHQNQTVETKVKKENKNFTVCNSITTKPLIMPRSFKNNQTYTLQEAMNQPTEECKVTPLDDNTSMFDSHKLGNKDIQSVQEDLQQSQHKNTSKSQSGNSDNTAIKELQESNSLETDRNVADFNIHTSMDLENKVYVESSKETKAETDTSNDIHGNQMNYTPAVERLEQTNKVIVQTEITAESLHISGDAAEGMSESSSNISNDVREAMFKDKVTTSDYVNTKPDKSYQPKVKVSFDKNYELAIRCADGATSDDSEKQVSASDVTDSQSPRNEYSAISDRINVKLDTLKSELMAMRKMDLVLLRQLINISQKMQRIQRADALRVSRSLTFLNRNKTMPRRCRPVERQNSAPHCADRRRFLFSNLKSNTEDDLRDSLSSFDESEFDSSPSEVEESTISLNNILANSPRSATNRRNFFKSHDLLASLEIAEDAEQNYEDILRRNVRLWKMSFQQRHQSVQEEVDVWF